MTLVTLDPINPDEEITADSANRQPAAIAAVLNGNVDDTNISGVSGTKLSDATASGTKLIDNTVPPAKLTTVSKAGFEPVTGNGTIVVSTVGFKPGSILFHSVCGTSPSGSQSANSSDGYYDTASNTQWTASLTAGAGAGGNFNGASYCFDATLVNGGTSAARAFRGAVTATSTSGFTVTVTDYTGTPGYFMWVAFR